MRAYQIIEKKRDGRELSPAEIYFFINSYNAGEIPDYQAAALLMAVYFQGMSEAETAALTKAMAESGHTLDFSGLGKPVADKHSTGGVGDKTTLVLLPLVAACGIHVAKMSGRGLGHTGGTIDKLACIPGFRTDLTKDEFMRQVAEVGLALAGQSPAMTPADGKLYALRDVTATVNSIPLIASSVMSKKIAAGASAIVLDVKAGSGAFMPDTAGARKLAGTMVAVGRALGRKTTALITSMDQPLGCSVGNHAEVLEAIETLAGAGPDDLRELCLHLGAEMLVSCKVTENQNAALALLERKLRDGSALDFFRKFISAQGGNPKVADNPSLLGSAPYSMKYYSPRDGYIAALSAGTVGSCAVALGAGRMRKEDDIDLYAGIRLHGKTGRYIKKGEILAEIFAGDEKKLAAACEILASAYLFSAEAVNPAPLIIGRVD